MIKIDSFRLHKLPATSRVKKENVANTFKELESTQESQSLGHFSQTSALSSLAPLEELLQLQSVSSDTAFTGVRSQEEGEKILKELDKLRVTLLTGELASSDLHHLSGILKQNLAPGPDSQLNAIVEEIEQRLAIEITKLEMSQS